MKTYILAVMLMLLFVNANAQQVMVTENVTELSRRIKKESFSFSNHNNKDLVTLISEGNKLLAYLYDKDFKLKAKFALPNMRAKYADIIGYQINNGSYEIVYANTNKKKFAVLSLNFETSSHSISEHNFKAQFKNELFLDTVTYNNTLYFLSLTKSTDISIKTFTNGALKEQKRVEVNLNRKKERAYYSQIGLFNLLHKDYSIDKLVKINHKIPNTIEQVSEGNKLYQFDEVIKISIENIENATLVYSINLNDFSESATLYPYAKGKLGEFKRHNSFLTQDAIFQINASKEEMIFDVKAYDNTLLKTFYVNKDRNITFKNSKIVQEGQTGVPFITSRELSATKKYLRKITRAKVGVSVLKENDFYRVTLGGFELINRGAVGVGAPTQVSVNANGFVTSYNPVYNSFSNYNTTKSTYFKTKLDLGYQHLKTKLNPSIFSKIETFKKTFKYYSAENVFEHNNTLYYAYVNQKFQKFKIIKF